MALQSLNHSYTSCFALEGRARLTFHALVTQRHEVVRYCTQISQTYVYAFIQQCVRQGDTRKGNRKGEERSGPSSTSSASSSSALGNLSFRAKAFHTSHSSAVCHHPWEQKGHGQGAASSALPCWRNGDSTSKLSYPLL